MREFIPINDRLSTFLTQPEDQRTIMQRYHNTILKIACLATSHLKVATNKPAVTIKPITKTDLLKSEYDETA